MRRLLLVGAFPYPHDQGSQIYFQEQAIALRSAGADISLLTYGAGRNPRANASPNQIDDARMAEHWRALDGFTHHRSPKWTAPSSLRAGPSWTKPLADFGLAMTLRDALASSKGPSPYDAILTHNAEATLAAIHGLRKPRPPIIYCGHTLLSQELSAYLRGPKTRRFWDRVNPLEPDGRLAAGLDRFGASIDRWLARRVDGWIVLTRASECVMRQFSKAPGAVVPPALPDPLSDPIRFDTAETTRRHGLEPGGYFLYSGNLDGYQELDILAAARAELAAANAKGRSIVVASHCDSLSPNSSAWVASMPDVDFCRVESSAEMQGLLAGARASLLMRRSKGGFPIKLVNSLALGTPAITFLEGEWGLENDRDSLLCSPERPVASLVAAIERLEEDDALVDRLGKEARRLYLARHRPKLAAERTLKLVEEVCSVRGNG